MPTCTTSGAFGGRRVANRKSVIACRFDDGEKTEVFRRDGKFYIETRAQGFRCRSCFRSETEALQAFDGND